MNNRYNVTLSPPEGPCCCQSYLQTQGPMSFEAAALKNNIYRNNGLICQSQFCQDLTGVKGVLTCPNHKDWNKVLQFCGPNRTGAMAMDGNWWVLDSPLGRQQTMVATQRDTGFRFLPNSSNVYQGQYGPVNFNPC